ncbi:MAG: glycosyltransferase family protein [Magnetococcales bacterium]|nr:glycosyltransferase family protein [Magnetococcales bacterium]MBF0113734.1 glycosyltransferase family protein [Magnetococcales bacterium]
MPHLSPETTPLTSDQLLVLYKNCRFAEALALAERLLVAFPDHPALLACAIDCGLRLAWSAQQEERWSEAEALYRRLLRLNPHHPETLFRLGYLLQEQNHPEAETLYRQLLVLQPEQAEAWYNLANLLKQHNRLADAHDAYQQAIRLHPQAQHARAWQNLGLLLQTMQQNDAAKRALQEAIRLEPQHADLHANLGNLLHKNGDDAAAEVCYRQALALHPQHKIYLCNLGIILAGQQRISEAEACYRSILQQDPQYGDARWNLGLLLLRQERYAEGWACYEARLLPGQRQHEPPQWSFPQWRGESLQGLSLLVLCEQGFGDTIQFCRYLPLLRQQGVRRLTLLCPAPLLPLLHQLPGVDLLSDETPDEQIPPHERWIFLMSIPHCLGASFSLLPLALPYLAASSARTANWRNRLPANRLLIGLCWQGSPLHKNDRQRSLSSLRLLAPLWQMTEVVWVSLQMGEGSTDCAQYASTQPLIELGSQIKDFADTAAILSLLHGVVTVDSAVAHLCGALAKPCWLLLPRYNTDWRWLLERADSPWYPGVMQLFRQESMGEWQGVIERVMEQMRQTLLPTFSGRADSTHPDPNGPVSH